MTQADALDAIRCNGEKLTQLSFINSAEGVLINRVCSAEEVAHLVLYAANDSAKFNSGYPPVMDGGNRA